MSTIRTLHLEGDWEETEHGYKFTFRTDLDIVGTSVSGRIMWKLEEAASDIYIAPRVGNPKLNHGYEKVTGTFEGRKVILTGTYVWPKTLLSPTSYEIEIDNSNGTFQGISKRVKANGPGKLVGMYTMS